jgi:hypothetical protein
MPSTALVPILPDPVAADPEAADAAARRAERYLARVAALPPDVWGRLDAVGARQVRPTCGVR